MTGWMHGRLDAWVDWMHGLMHRWMDAWVNVYSGGQMDAGMYG